MHIKHMHEMIEKLAEYGKQMVYEGTGSGEVNLEATKCVIEMVEKLAKAEYYARISKAMEEADEEEKEEIKYIIKKMKEEYGDEDGERRFYDNYRYKTSGRFAPKGKGSYMPRRGFEQPIGYGMMPEIYNPMEYYRDMDRMDGKMYYSGGGQSSGGNSGGQSGQSSGGSSSSSGMSGNIGGNTRGYSDGYSDGLRDGSRNNQRDSREGRSGRNRRFYMETKEMNKGNSPEEKQRKMKELESYMKELSEDVTEMISDATPEEKSLLKQKMQVLMQKI